MLTNTMLACRCLACSSGIIIIGSSSSSSSSSSSRTHSSTNSRSSSNLLSVQKFLLHLWHSQTSTEKATIQPRPDII